MDTSHPVSKLLIIEGLPGLAKLHKYAAISGMIDSSSVSIAPECRVSCDYMITQSTKLFCIYPMHLRLYASLRRMGDGSGMFGFGAKRYLDGAWSDVSVCDHIALIAGAAEAFERQHLELIDKLADGFALVPLSALMEKSDQRLM
jgi:hypothetical protein